MIRSFVPNHILKAIALHANGPAAEAAMRSIVTSTMQRTQRRLTAVVNAGQAVSPLGYKINRLVYTAGGMEVEPGTLVRKEDQSAVIDLDANLAYDYSGIVYDFFRTAFGRDSIDGRGMPIVSTVDYGDRLDNAMWSGGQMDYGKGDGVVFNSFLSVIDIAGHELSHGVTQYTSNLNYQGQSGALNESFSDCMGSCVKQFALGQTADTADWLIGQGLFTAAVHGRALRDMRKPGMAYDDPQLGGRDPQPAHMSKYVHTSDDDGGVHLNSGIPNRAFADACVMVGGKSWEKVGLVWYKTNQKVSASCNFQDWADMTVKQATSLLTPSTVDLIRSAWAGVGIKVAGPVVVPVPQPPVPEPPPAPPPSSPSPTRQQVVGALDAGFAELARKNNGPFRQFVQAVLTQAKPTLEEAVSKPFAGQAEGQPLTFENFFDR